MIVPIIPRKSAFVRKVFAAMTCMMLAACGSEGDPPSRGGETDGRPAKANEQSATSSEGGVATEGGLEAGPCDKTINCNNGNCSCGSGSNAGKACNKDSGECDVLCSQC